METRASLRGVRLSEQKGRLVADLVRGKPVGQALDILAFCPKKGAGIVKKFSSRQSPTQNTMTVLISTNSR